jgi:hypothetical protein
MYPRTHLLGLPREVRDLVYDFYFTLPGGYMFHFESKKLQDDEYQPLNLFLLYSCRQIASETHDLPLRLNTITFTTRHSRAMSATAGLFNLYLRKMAMQKNAIVRDGASVASHRARGTRAVRISTISGSCCKLTTKGARYRLHGELALRVVG